MSSYRQICYHIIFGTKYRLPAISEAHCKELYAYVFGVIKNKQCHLYRIGGVEDHLHIFTDLHPSISLADLVKTIKVASSIWIKEKNYFPLFAGWQEGYGAFTCSAKERQRVIDYIKNQTEHHKRESFFDEYRRLLIESEIVSDERYML